MELLTTETRGRINRDSVKAATMTPFIKRITVRQRVNRRADQYCGFLRPHSRYAASPLSWRRLVTNHDEDR